MKRAPAAVIGGFLGVSVMSVLLLFLEVEVRSAFLTFDAVARYVGAAALASMLGLDADVTALGFLIFLLAGIFLWPLLFVAIEDYLPLGPDPAYRAMVLASILWVAFVITSAAGEISGPVLLVYAFYTYIAHLVYGFTLGAVYGRLVGSTASRDSPVESSGASP